MVKPILKWVAASIIGLILSAGNSLCAISIITSDMNWIYNIFIYTIYAITSYLLIVGVKVTLEKIKGLFK